MTQMGITFPKKSTKGFSEGFTIVETLIVLVIAGIMLLLVLEVIPSLKRTASNNERKQDVATILNAVSQYELKDSDNFPLPCGGLSAGGISQQTCNVADPSASNPNDYFLQFVFGRLSIYSYPNTYPNDVQLIPQNPNPGGSGFLSSIPPVTSTEEVQVYNYAVCNTPPYSTPANPSGGANDVDADYNSVVALYALDTGSSSSGPACKNI